MNRTIRRKLMEAERPPSSIEKWYEHAINLDRHWRESRREQGAMAPKQQQQQVLQSQVWQRRQKMPQQRMTIGSALMEGVERMDVVMVCLQ